MKLLSAALLLAALISPAWGDDLSRQVQDYRAAHEATIVGQLDELVRLRSVAADPSGLAATAARLGISLRQIRYRIARLNISAPSDNDAHDDLG